MFDYMMGAYNWITDVNSTFMDLLHTGAMIMHIYLANIFMLNYLVAILADVFGELQEQAAFSFNSNSYMFIERYNIAFQDDQGYYELVLHPPPINIMLVSCLPSIFNPENMNSA